MKSLNPENTFVKAGAAALIAVMFITSSPVSALANGGGHDDGGSQVEVTVDLKVNGSDGPVEITEGDNFTYTWESTGATQCELTSPYSSGISLSGESAPVVPGDLEYPTLESSVTLTVKCFNDEDDFVWDKDSVVVKLVPGQDPVEVTVDLKVNDSDGPVTINESDTFTYTWESTGATQCELTSPYSSGISLSGTSAEVVSGDLEYPTVATSTTLTVHCFNDDNEATDSVVVHLTEVNEPTEVTVDLKVNDSDGPVTINEGDTFTYSWTSTGATQCELTSPYSSGISLSGTSTPIVSGDLEYPTTATSTTLTVHCFNDDAGATDTVVVSLEEDNGGGGGGPSCPVPTITSSITASVVEDSTLTYTVTYTSSTSTPVINVDIANLPEGLSYSTSTLTISGTPTETGTFNIPMTVTDPCGSDSETLVITVTEKPTTPTGGGGGGGSRSGGSSRGGQVLGAVDITTLCPLLKEYMRIDFNNNPVEVTKLQAFLVNFEGHTNVTVNGVFDQATYDAVSAFQIKYFDDVLAPWGHTTSTGYVYITTLKKINEIFCQKLIPFTQGQLDEINAFRAYISNPANYGIGGGEDVIIGSTTGTPNIIIPDGTPIKDIVGVEEDQKEENKAKVWAGNIAGVLFARPETSAGTLDCIYWFLLILVVLYILGSVLESVIYKDVPENTRKRFLAKWITISVGLVVAIVLAYLLDKWCLILPLIIALIVSLIWTLTYPKHGSMRASVKSWYLVVVARLKSLGGDKSKTPATPTSTPTPTPVAPVIPPTKHDADTVIPMGPSNSNDSLQR